MDYQRQGIKKSYRSLNTNPNKETNKPYNQSPTKYLRRYDEKNPNTGDEQDPFLEKTSISDGTHLKSLTKYLVLKKLYKALIFAIITCVVITSRLIINYSQDVTGEWTSAGDSHSLTINAQRCYIYLSNQAAAGSGLKL